MTLDVRELAPERVRPLRREEYERLAELGRFEDERVELLDGMLVVMTPPGPPHASAVDRLTRLLLLAVGDRAVVRVQNPLALSDLSEPDPDLAVVPPGDYVDAHPQTAWLVVEVAHESLNKDRRIKTALYAAAGIAEYWIVDIAGRRIEVYKDPRAGRYTSVESRQPGDVIQLGAFADAAIAVSDVVR
jgi:Uma2 family endonuclease